MDHSPKIFSDGERMAILFDGIVYFMSSYYLTQVTNHMIRSVIDVSSLDSPKGVYRDFITGMCSSELNLTVRCPCEVIVGGPELLEGFMTVDNLSIEGLLKVIQQRIVERDGK